MLVAIVVLLSIVTLLLILIMSTVVGIKTIMEQYIGSGKIREFPHGHN
jgi:hypothetical protein